MPGTQHLYFYLRLALFVAYFINGIIAIQFNSVASDETDHMSYGLRMLKGQPQKIDPFEDGSTMPVSVLNALPRAVEQILDPGLEKTDGGTSDAINGRYVTLVLCVLIGLFVYRWSKEMFGEQGGLFSLFCFVFCPNSQANITLVGTDAYAMLFTLTAAYYFRKFILFSGWRNFILFSAQLGFALIAKQSLFLLPLFFSVTSLVILVIRGSLFNRFTINLGRLAVLCLVVLAIINIAYLFNGIGHSLSQYNFRSSTFQHMQQWQLLNKIPLPLPVPFVEGFDIVRYMLSLGSGHEEVSKRSYLLGSYFTGNALWYYYSVILFFKSPLSVLLLLAGTIFLLLKKPFSKTNFFNTGYPILLAFFFIAFISLNNTSQHSIRHLVMIYPLFYVCFGQALQWKIFRSVASRLILVGYMLFTFYLYFPNLISYTNEFLPDKTKVYKVLASSNIDHGQGGIYLKKYLAKHPETVFPTTQPAAGTFIIRINDYLDLKGNGEFAWLRNFEPFDHVNHCYLLFRVTENDLLNKHLK